MSLSIQQGKPALVIISSELVQVEVVQVWDNEVQVRKADGAMSWRSIHNVAPLDPRLAFESPGDEPAAQTNVETASPASLGAGGPSKRGGKRAREGKAKKRQPRK